MDYIESEQELIEEFSDCSIEVFYGSPCRKANTDFYIYGIQSMMDYCVSNDICTVFFDCRYAEQLEDTVARLKEDLEKRYKSAVAGYVSGVFKLPYVDESFYEPVWRRILEQLEQKASGADAAEPAQDAEKEITSIHVWAFHQGVRLYTTVKIGSEEADRRESEPKLLYRKYQNMLSDALSERRKEAFEESKRIELEKQQAVLDKLASTVRQDPSMLSLRTVKARSDYADRICVKWQTELGHGWLTKKAVRSIVELEYANSKM